jgi:hypothetical protein
MICNATLGSRGPIAHREAENRDQIHAAWREVLGDLADQK